MNNDQELMDYKQIDAKYRMSTSIGQKANMIKQLKIFDECIDMTNRYMTETTNEEYTDLFLTKLKLLKIQKKFCIYFHNGDVRNLVKYNGKYNDGARPHLEYAEKYVEQDSMLEETYIWECDTMKNNYNIHRKVCFYSIDAYKNR